MRRYEAMNPSNLLLGAKAQAPLESREVLLQTAIHTVMVLALESMILQNVYSLQEALEYYDAALECDSQPRITATMGR